MHYLIDGHNLIGRMPDISLDDPQDEVELVLRLRSWSARSRKRRVTVVFDRGLPGGRDRGLSSTKVDVVFASAGRSADSILIARVNNVKNPREYTLVTSDNRIINEAGAKRMPVLRSEEFAQKLAPEIKNGVDQDGETDNSPDETTPQVSNAEVEMWLHLFNSRQE